MATARSASWTKAASASASEKTATVSIPRLRHVRMMRRAISPRLAMSSRSIIGASHPEHAVAALAPALVGEHGRQGDTKHVASVAWIDEPVVVELT